MTHESINVSEVRKRLGARGATLTDEQVRQVHEDLCLLVDILFDMWLEQRRSPLSSQPPAEHKDGRSESH